MDCCPNFSHRISLRMTNGDESLSCGLSGVLQIPRVQHRQIKCCPRQMTITPASFAHGKQPLLKLPGQNSDHNLRVVHKHSIERFLESGARAIVQFPQQCALWRRAQPKASVQKRVFHAFMYFCTTGFSSDRDMPQPR